MSEVKTTIGKLNSMMPRFLAGVALDIETELARTCPVDTGMLRNSIIARVEGNDIEISMAGYGKHVEFGTPPHIIEAKNAKALHWTSKGVGPRGGDTKVDHFAKKVRHPGTRPQPFIRTTLHQKLQDIVMINLKRALQ